MIQKEMGGEVASAGVSAGESLGSKMVGALKAVVVAAGIGKAIGAALSEVQLFNNLLAGLKLYSKIPLIKLKVLPMKHTKLLDFQQMLIWRT